jgi:hypothetical protein
MLDLGTAPAGHGGEQGSQPEVAREAERAVLVTLVPNSSVQFLDFEMPAELVARTRRRYLEEHEDGAEPCLHAVMSSDGVFHHPLTGEPCAPEQTYTIGGIEALAPFLECWLPVPYMRVSESEQGDRTILEEGPSNWTRVHITREPIDGMRWRYRLVLAVDTAVEHDPAAPARGYVGPTLDDLKAGAAFRFSDDVGDVAWFVSEAWVDDWIKGIYAAAAVGTAQKGEDGLAHLASYLTLLGVLKEACDLPAIRFMEPNAVGAFAQFVPADLALDLGCARLKALVQEWPGARGSGGDIRPLSVRDLGRPSRVWCGTMASRLTFSRASFGNEALSRWSGRTRAFHWPSLARFGEEAERLARGASTGQAQTGVSSPLHYVWDEQPSRHVWRFAATGEPDGPTASPVVSGSVLAHLTEAGEVVESRSAAAPTTKPRFSRSSLVTLLIAEVLLQAIGLINAPAWRAQGGRPQVARRLQRLVITPPAGMGDLELAILRRRVEAGVKLVWQAMDWAIDEHPLAPAPPMITIAADAGTSVQAAWLENEVTHKLRGRADSLLALTGRARSGFSGSRVARIATLDVGASTTGITVATWELATDGALAATRQLVDGFETGSEAIVKALAERIVLPAIADRLAECRHADPARLLEALVGADERSRPAWVGDLGRRITADVLAPAARAMLALYAGSETDADDAPCEHSIGTLLASVGAEAKDVCDRLDVVAADEGAEGFAPLEVAISFLMRDVAAVARDVLQPTMDAVVRVLAALDCDLVLLAGDGARLPIVGELLLAEMPLRPDRILDLHRHRFAAPFARVDGWNSAMLAACGSLVLVRGQLGGDGIGILVRSNDRSREAGFIGRIDERGMMREDEVLFDVSQGLVTPAGRAGAGRDMAGTGARTTVSALPAHLGIRPTSLDGWPCRTSWVIERGGEAAGRAPKLPLRVSVELLQPERGKPGGLVLGSVIDGDGGRIDPSEIVVRLKTRRFRDGHWLDTGHLDVTPRAGV